MARGRALWNSQGDVVCPISPQHRLSADTEPRSYYCYVCGEHYAEAPRACGRRAPQPYCTCRECVRARALLARIEES